MTTPDSIVTDMIRWTSDVDGSFQETTQNPKRRGLSRVEVEKRHNTDSEDVDSFDTN